MSIATLGRAAKETVSGLPDGFWWLWTSTLVNRTGAFVLTFLSLYLTQELGYSAWYAGLVIALHGLGGVAGSPLGGMLTDRWGRRPTMIAGHLGTAAGAAALAVVTSAVGVAVVVLLMGVAMQAVRPAIGATIADLVPENERRRAYALNYWALNLGFAIAALGGGAAIVFGYRTLFVVDAAATVLCALIVFLRLPETRPVAAPLAKGEEAVAEPKVSVLEVLRDAPFRTLVLLNLLVCLIFTAPWVGLPLTMAGEGLEPSAYGMVIAVNGVVIVGFQLLVNKITDRRSPAALLTVSALLFAAGTGATALAGTPLLFAVTVVVWTLGEMVHVPTNAAATARLAPDHARGRYQGVMGMSWALAGFLAPILAGWIVDGPGPDALWIGCGVVGCVAAAGYTTRLRRVLADSDAPDAAAKDEVPPVAAAPVPPAEADGEKISG
ncbi:transporter [Streptomyces agglomeratus]|uniref:Transporter n=1 Tax=Streptomyces agglomeratus TaxID=285458 RepID=A0A1E5P9X3_9ACTN|nr:MFS transporter [Streptomyces agglomeratus]OEJ26267.1 transporter [Streptomyces agglomeratus]OEJ39674.1 transporter [Streptomyces agglomeratus]OEJ45942.1 transporter [Streptomyces agglomeratus]OEJ52236.1 transporter [Streptomyces agglomeratus]OEJ59593.1 transporter [Streptomyces agglomeratus]